MSAPASERSDCPCGERWTLVRFFQVRRAAGLALRDLRERHEEEYQQLLAEHKEALLSFAEQEWAEHAEHRPDRSPDGRRPAGRECLDAAAGDRCGLSIELPAEVPAPAVGDWIVTRAGSRDVVTACGPSSRVRQRTGRPLVRYELRCLMLPMHCPVPADVRAIRLPWDRP